MLKVKIEYEYSDGNTKKIENVNVLGVKTIQRMYDTYLKEVDEDSPLDDRIEVGKENMNCLPGIGYLDGLKSEKGYVQIGNVHIYHHGLSDEIGSNFEERRKEDIIMISEILHGKLTCPREFNRVEKPKIETMADVYKHIK